MNLHWHDVVGGSGVVLLLVTYLLLQLNYVSAKSLGYSVANAIGASLILISLRYNFNLSAFMIEASWLVISCIGVAVTIVESRKSKRAV